MGGKTISDSLVKFAVNAVVSTYNIGLARFAVDAAARSAVEYLKAHNLKADPDALLSCIRSWCKIKLPEALRDAKDALDAGMSQAAEQTFAATMALAGIEAAKEAGLPA